MVISFNLFLLLLLILKQFLLPVSCATVPSFVFLYRDINSQTKQGVHNWIQRKTQWAYNFLFVEIFATFFVFFFSSQFRSQNSKLIIRRKKCALFSGFFKNTPLQFCIFSEWVLELFKYDYGAKAKLIVCTHGPQQTLNKWE